MSFWLGVAMFFVCHSVANRFANNLYCYVQEEKSNAANKYAMKQYFTQIITCLVIYILILIVTLVTNFFAEYISVLLIANGIGFITGFIHFVLIAEDNYKQQKEKNGRNSWNYMSLEEKRSFLEKQQTINGEQTYNENSSKSQHTKSLHHIDDEDFKKNPIEEMDYVDIIMNYLRDKEGIEATLDIAPMGDKVITINYQIKYLWTLCVVIDEEVDMIKMYAPFFDVSALFENKIYELLNEWNRKFFFVKFHVENNPMGLLVIAENDVPLIDKNSIGEFLFARADQFVQTIDNLFAEVPKEIIG